MELLHCGLTERETVRSVPETARGVREAAKAKNKDNYAYSQTFKISGMTCSNCAKRIENELNELDGVWADVNFESASAEVRAKSEINTDTICGIVARLGYSAVRE